MAKKKKTAGSTTAEIAREEASVATNSDEEPLNLEAATDEHEARPEGTEWFVIHSYSGYENKVQKNLFDY